MLRIAAARTAEDRLDEFAAAQPGDGVLALLPRPTPRSWCDDESVHARVWLGWLELWRGDPMLAPCLAAHHRTLRHYVALLTEGRLPPEQVIQLIAFSEGLQSQMANPVSPLAPAAARQLLADTLKALHVAASPVRPGQAIPDHLAAPFRWMRRANRGGPWRAEAEVAELFRFQGGGPDEHLTG